MDSDNNIVQHPESWHEPSDQPFVISDRLQRREWRRGTGLSFVRAVLAAMWRIPYVLICGLFLGTKKAKTTRKDFCIIAVSPERDPSSRHTVSLLNELGCRHILLRIPVWQRAAFITYRSFLEKILMGCSEITDYSIVIMQDRSSVENPHQWKIDCENILDEFCTRAPKAPTAVIIGQAGNRLKWGCASIDQYVQLCEIIPDLRRRFDKPLYLAGNLIDFDPLGVSRLSACGNNRIQADGAAVGLYVDRRGAPEQTQMGVFNAARKMTVTAYLFKIGQYFSRQKEALHFWISEFNWPLKDRGESSPAAENVCVDEEDAARYILTYLEMAEKNTFIERVCFWQLISNGYGLTHIDENDEVHMHAAFIALRDWLHSE